MQGNRKTRQGTVVSNKMAKTVVVAVETLRRHPLYGKQVRRTKRLYAHDERGECRQGDLVNLRETRPLSRLKRWEVVEVVRKGDVAEIQPQVIGRELEQLAPAEPAAQPDAERPVED